MKYEYQLCIVIAIIARLTFRIALQQQQLFNLQFRVVDFKSKPQPRGTFRNLPPAPWLPSSLSLKMCCRSRWPCCLCLLTPLRAFCFSLSLPASYQFQAWAVIVVGWCATSSFFSCTTWRPIEPVNSCIYLCVRHTFSVCVCVCMCVCLTGRISVPQRHLPVIVGLGSALGLVCLVGRCLGLLVWCLIITA